MVSDYAVFTRLPHCTYAVLNYLSPPRDKETSVDIRSFSLLGSVAFATTGGTNSGGSASSSRCRSNSIDVVLLIWINICTSPVFLDERSVSCKEYRRRPVDLDHTMHFARIVLMGGLWGSCRL